MVFDVLAVCHFVIPMFVYIGDDFCNMGVVGIYCCYFICQCHMCKINIFVLLGVIGNLFQCSF